MQTIRSVPRNTCGLFALAALVCAVSAAEPPSGELSPAQPSLEFTAGPFLLSNLGGRVLGDGCVTETGSCEEYVVTLNLPSDYLASHPRAEIVVELDWSNPQADFDLVVVDDTGTPVVYSGSSAKPESALLPAEPGQHQYTLQVFAGIPLGDTVQGSIRLRDSTLPQLPPASGAPPRFQRHAAPASVAVFAGEPTMDVNPRTNTALFLAFLETYRLDFDDSTSPAAATWTQVSAESTKRTSQDPILNTDPQTGRSFVIQLQLATSLIAFTDDDGESWTTSTGPGAPHGFDHPSLGLGPYPAGLEILRRGSYANAVYYCSQALIAATCSRSDDGGLSFAPAVPIYTGNQCQGGHGFVTVAPDGTVYVPNQACDNRQAFAVSADAGQTWQVRTLPFALAAIGSHPSIAFDAANTLYFAYQAADGRARVAVTRDRGVNWQHDQDVGERLGIRNSVFQSVVAGDDGRAAMAFLGSETPGNYQATDYPGVWYLYIAMTYDGGASWHLVNGTPGDPVQGPGGVCVAGIACTGNRNLYDFNDIAVDAKGRVLAAFADGCIGDCVRGGHSTFSSVGAFARQSGGRGLFARFDTVEPAVPGAPLLSAERGSDGVLLSWPLVDDGGSAVTNYRVYRALGNGPFSLLADTGVVPAYADRSARDPALSYRYAVSASNAVGEGQRGNELSPALAAGDGLEACSLPGIKLFDDLEDANTAPATPEIEVQSLSIAEPLEQPGQLVVTLKLAALPPVLLPGRHWRITLDAPDRQRYFLIADTLESGTPVYSYGRYGTPEDHSAPVPLGEPDSVEIGADGSLIFTIARDKIGASGPGTLEAVLVRAYVGDPTSVFDDAGPGRYRLRPASGCAEHAAPPPEPPPPSVPPPTAPPIAAVATGSGRFGGFISLSLLLTLNLLAFARLCVRAGLRSRLSVALK